jgi:hypothetical protein
MIIEHTFDLARVVFAFALVYFALPLAGLWLSFWRGELQRRSLEQWLRTALFAFIRASLFCEIGGLLLGRLRLCLPGLMVGLFILWAALELFSAYRNRGLRTCLHRGCCPIRARALAVCAAIVLLSAARIPLIQAHFDHASSYARTLTLARLVSGQPVDADGSVALLAPLLPVSGLPASAVIRFSDAIFSAALALLIAICAWRATRSLFCPVAVIGVCSGLLLSGHTDWELNPHAIAMVYWVAAAAVWQRRGTEARRYALLAGVTGLMIAPDFWAGWVASGLAAIALSTPSVSRGGVRRSLAYAQAALIGFGLIAFWQRQNTPKVPLEYESAARVCEHIANKFPHNSWLIVSPTQDLAYIYGQGWHMELTGFVSRFASDEVAQSSFRFPYKVKDVFLVVERRPLPTGLSANESAVARRYSPAESGSVEGYLYNDPLGRASLEYRAADLINAYSATHNDVTRFFQDENLTVYHITRDQT